jgi:hypothetical protein
MNLDWNTFFKTISDFPIWPILAKAIEVGAELVTLILGLFALYALIFHGKRVSLALKALSYLFLNIRAQKVRNTLSKLSARSYDAKEHRKEIVALLGELSGQLQPFVSMGASVEKSYQELVYC